jgi:hypothetical protein
MKRVLLVTAVLMSTVCRPVAAQTDPAPPRFEVGGHLGVLSAIEVDGAFSLFLWGPRVSVRLTNNLGVELSTDLRTASYGSGSRALYGTYYLVGRYSFRRPRWKRLHLFATFGGVGWFERVSIPGYSRTFPDGVRITIADRTVTSLERPNGIVGGIGMDRPVNSHVALRVSAEGVFGSGLILGIRLCGGVSVPIGSYHRQ